MKIILRSDTLSRSELAAGLSLTRAFFPEGQVEVDEGEKAEKGIEAEKENSNKNKFKNEKEARCKDTAIIQIDVYYPDHPWRIQGSFSWGNPHLVGTSITLDEDQMKAMLSHPYVGKETKQKLFLKCALYVLLSHVTGHNPPWGTLTGIRPSKILHRLTDRGYSIKESEGSLRELYLMREDKAQLLGEVVSIQEPFVQRIKANPHLIALYIGIPFCPTRCSYCSFPAYSLQKSREPLQKYLEALGEEIRVTGEWMKEKGLVADSIYIGGGTPTILNNSEISSLITLIDQNIPTINSNLVLPECQQGLELTVEAGRPDTLSQEKILALRESGVNRISINPQTMHNRTLQRIGRAHTVEDILKVYHLAQEIPGWVINMDLIIGLPGENLEDIQETLRIIEELNPVNLTAHTLAIKRGSKEHEQGLIQNLGKELEAMQETVLMSARKMGMVPYYLYRQKHISGNLENIGFAKVGMECRYNIGIMEEYQTVIGLGAGASSKIVNPQDYSLISLYHPSNWQVYRERWQETQRKREKAYEELKG